MRVEVVPQPIAASATYVRGGNNLDRIVAGIWHRTYEKKKAEVIQSNNSPVLSPPKTSSGRPCSLALPKFDLSRANFLL